MPLPKRLGPETSEVGFLITLSHKTAPPPVKIERITAVLEPPYAFLFPEHDSTRLQFIRKNGLLPSVREMVEQLVRAERERLLRYANAYKINQKIAKKRKRAKGGKSRDRPCY